jgi:hypothetical protein
MVQDMDERPLVAQGSSTEILGLRSFTPLILDLFAPLAVYALLSRLGASDFVGLGVAAALPAIYIAVAVIRGRPIDRIAILVLILLLVAIALTLVTGDPRILLAKSVVVTGAAGLYILSTLLAEHSFIFHASQRLYAGGDPAKEAAWEARWQSSSGFRRAIRRLTLIWGLGLMGEAVVRAGIIYTLPVAQSVVWGQVWAIAVFLALIAISVRSARRGRAAAEAAGGP